MHALTSTKNQLRNAYYKNTPNLLFEYQCTSSKFIRLPNRIETFFARIGMLQWPVEWSRQMALQSGCSSSQLQLAGNLIHAKCCVFIGCFSVRIDVGLQEVSSSRYFDISGPNPVRACLSTFWISAGNLLEDLHCVLSCSPQLTAFCKTSCSFASCHSLCGSVYFGVKIFRDRTEQRIPIRDSNRFDSIRYANRFESIRLVNSKEIGLSIHQLSCSFYLFIYCNGLSQKIS